MKRPLLKIFSLWVAFVTLSACTTVHVAKVVQDEPDTEWHYWLNPLNYWVALTGSEPIVSDEDAEGIRYYLPKPYLLVTANGTGGMNVETVFLPDTSQEYAVDVGVFLASQNFQVTISDGFLGKVTYSPNDAEMLSKLIESSGTVGSDIITKKGEIAKVRDDEAKKKKEEREKDLKSLSDKLDTAQAELRSLNFKVEQAEQALRNFDLLFPSLDNVEKKQERQKLEAKVREAEFNRDEKQSQIDLLEQNFGTLSSKLTDAPRNPIEEAISDAPGPVLFEVVDSGDNVTLKQVNFHVSGNDPISQPILRTYRPIAVTEVQDTMASLNLTSSPTVITRNGSYLVEFSFDQKLDNAEPFITIVKPNQTPVNVERGPAPPDSPKAAYFEIANKKLTIDLKKSEFVAGEYSLKLIHSKFTNTQLGMEISFSLP